MKKSLFLSILLVPVLMAGCKGKPEKIVAPVRQERPLITIEVVKVHSGRDGRGNPAILVPKSAVFQKGGHDGVFVAGKDNVLWIRWVSLGRSAGSDVVVLAGLDEGDRVAGSPGDSLREGITINVK
jgi:multidrug efflux pump subunit AcrA (membrane-fusion protein)